jgi:predicted DNA binding CopG/RHH family protein
MQTKLPHMKKRAPEKFLDADISGLDFSQFKPFRFEFEKKEEQINMHVPKSLLDPLRARARERGIPYTRLIRETLEHAITHRN